MNKIKVTKEGEHYYTADPTWMTGSPVVGHGRTPLHALMNLFAWNEKFDFDIDDTTGESFPETKYFDVDDISGVLYYCPKCKSEPSIKGSREEGYWISCVCGNSTDVYKDNDGRCYALRNAAKRWNGEGYVETFRE